MVNVKKRIPINRSQDRAHKRKACVDCIDEGITTARKAPHPGPRCATHHRAKRAKRNSTTREQRWLDLYGITGEEYWRIHEAQGGHCYICQRAKGTGRRRLSVDHCHETGIVRGLLCQPCNRDVLGHAKDDVQFFERAIMYLEFPPATLVIGERRVPSNGAPVKG
jgi:hypothetical protein